MPPAMLSGRDPSSRSSSWDQGIVAAPLSASSWPSGTTTHRSNNLQCDYDTNPSILYQCIEARQWNHCRKSLRSESGGADVESATWVCRKEENGRLRWRMLPIHAAVIFGAPVDVIELLLQAHREATRAKDDQGMLPLHLSFRSESDWEVIEQLLVAYPQAIYIKDRKGRTPLQCTCSKRVQEVTVMDLHAQIAVSAERERMAQESYRMIETREKALAEIHAKTVERLKAEFAAQTTELEEELSRTKRELEELKALSSGRRRRQQVVQKEGNSEGPTRPSSTPGNNHIVKQRSGRGFSAVASFRRTPRKAEQSPDQDEASASPSSVLHSHAS